MYVKFVKCILKKCFDTNADINLAVLQVESKPKGPGLPSPVPLLFNRPIRDKMSTLSRESINFNYNDDHYDA